MEQVRAHLEAGYPNEACGALVGRPGDEHSPREAVEFRPMRNTVTDRPQDRYGLDPLEQLHVQKDAETRGLEIVGYVHSHPDGPPVPSRVDTDQAWPFYSYVVASVRKWTLAEARSWRLNEARQVRPGGLTEVVSLFREEPIEVT